MWVLGLKIFAKFSITENFDIKSHKSCKEEKILPWSADRTPTDTSPAGRTPTD
jgi:hypothetical protein